MLKLNKAPHSALVGGYDLLGEFADYDRTRNGGFDSDTLWNKTDAAVTISSNELHFSGAQAGAVNANQDMSLVIGRKFRSIYTVTGMSAGQCQIACGSGGAGTLRNSVGTYIEDIICLTNSSGYIWGDADFDGDLDNISFQELYTPDYSGRANNGTVNGGVIATPWGYSFDGNVGSYVQLGDVFDYTDKFTMMGWLKTSAKGDRIIGKRDGVNTQYDFYLLAATGALSLYDGTAERPASTNVADGNLHHGCIVIDGSNTRFYVDGRVDGTPISPSIASRAINTNIGAYNDGVGGPWTGTLRDIGIFNAVLTQREIQEEMRRLNSSLSMLV